MAGGLGALRCPAERRLHPATCDGKDENGNLVYEFKDRSLNLAATSGAPILNAAGEVVAINVASDAIPGRLFGVGNPVERFRPHLIESAKLTK